MRIIGHGVDLASIERVGAMLERHGDRFLGRCFTPAEAAYALASPKLRDERLAARFAAKEAAFKAVGTGWRHGIAWTDAEVFLLPSGAPTLQLRGALLRFATRQKINRWFLSLSHANGMAMASAIGVHEDLSTD